MEYTSEGSEQQLAQEFEICVLFILQIHAANYASEISELLCINHMVFVDGNVKDVLIKTREHTR
jgi:hypothetical protein